MAFEDNELNYGSGVVTNKAKIKALIWKNYLIKRAHYIETLIEFALPAVLLIVLKIEYLFETVDSTSFIQYIGVLPMQLLCVNLFIARQFS